MNRFTEIIYNCRQATFLIEKKSQKRLTFRETIELRIHLAGCSLCRIYLTQSSMISSMISNLLVSKPELLLDEEFKKNLQTKIDYQLNKN